MKCPCCGKDMEIGFVQSTHKFFFKKEQKKNFWGDMEQDGDILLSINNWNAPVANAYHCKNCKKVVIDYSETNK